MSTVIGVLLCVIFGFLAIASFCMATAEHKARREAEKKATATAAALDNAVKVTEGAQHEHAQINTGDHNSDFNNAINILHQHANK